MHTFHIVVAELVGEDDLTCCVLLDLLGVEAGLHEGAASGACNLSCQHFRKKVFCKVGGRELQ